MPILNPDLTKVGYAPAAPLLTNFFDGSAKTGEKRVFAKSPQDPPRMLLKQMFLRFSDRSGTCVQE